MPCTAVHDRRRDRPEIELADVFRQCSDPVSRLDGRQARVVRAILNCRTAALGGHIQQCDRCDHREIAYNSCRDRHCPKCQGSQQFRWLEAQQQHLLPIEYHHVVFTVPDTLHALFRANPRRCYGLLFAAVAETLQDVARNPRNLGATIGFSCVLHTWTQTLLFHPHIHCIVTGGGLDADRRRWVASRPGFLFPVRILAQLFRAKLLHRLESGLHDKSLDCDAADPHAALRAAVATVDRQPATRQKTRTIPIDPARWPAAPFNRPLTESLRDSANNPLCYGHPDGHLSSAGLPRAHSALQLSDKPGVIHRHSGIASST